jgi:CYTH domain-containing protein
MMLVKDPDFEYNHLWLRDQKRFLVLFNIPYEGTGFDVDDFAGATAKQVLLKVDTNDRGEEQNVLVLPKIETEEADEAPAKRAAGRSAGKPTRRR